MRRNALFLIPLLALTACATPRQNCINSVSRDLTVVNRLIAETDGNIQRGYAIEEEQDVRTIHKNCYFEDSEGNVESYDCDETYVFERDVPVAIDLRAERDKLEQLLQQRDRLNASVQPAIQQCIATYPE